VARFLLFPPMLSRYQVIRIGTKEEIPLTTSHRLAMFLAPFRTGFIRPTWRKVLILLEGTLLARGRRTMTAALRMMGLHQLAQFNVFHHVLSRARWSPLRMSRVLFLLLVRTFVPAGGPIQLVVDETLEQRWGPQIGKCSVYHDPVRSTERAPKMSRGLRWLCLMLVVKPVWARRALSP
jgi:DDE superfamily endonuclease